jgi:hypothetical protein
MQTYMDGDDEMIKSLAMGAKHLKVANDRFVQAGVDVKRMDVTVNAQLSEMKSSIAEGLGRVAIATDIFSSVRKALLAKWCPLGPYGIQSRSTPWPAHARTKYASAMVADMHWLNPFRPLIWVSEWYGWRNKAAYESWSTADGSSYSAIIGFDGKLFDEPEFNYHLPPKQCDWVKSHFIAHVTPGKFLSGITHTGTIYSN